MNFRNHGDYFIRPATPNDFHALNRFLQNENHILHRHLDWHLPGDWLGSQPFWVLGHSEEIQAAFAMPPDPPGVYWIRIFAAALRLRLNETWNLMFHKALSSFSTNDPSALIVSLALKKPYAYILQGNGFSHYQDIVVLEWRGDYKIRPSANKDIILRPMKSDDLLQIEYLDRLGFELIWQNSLNVITRAFSQSAHATVAEIDHKIIGYQVSTANNFHAHLARIVVHPDYQKQNIGYRLVEEMIDHFTGSGVEKITVNTQNNNLASLSLYHKIGFTETGDIFPVYAYTHDKE